MDGLSDDFCTKCTSFLLAGKLNHKLFGAVDYSTFIIGRTAVRTIVKFKVLNVKIKFEV